MRRRYVAGATMTEVASEAGMAVSAVHRRLAPLGIARPAHRPRKDVDIDAVRRLVEDEGKTQRQAAAELGISRRLVANALAGR